MFATESNKSLKHKISQKESNLICTRFFLHSFLYFLCFLLFFPGLSAQKIDLINIARLVAGPMQGHTTASSVKIWLLAKEADNIVVELAGNGEKHRLSATGDSLLIIDDFVPVTFTFYSLTPGTAYEVNVTLNGREVRDKKRITVKTLHNENSRNFSFLTGSCAFMPSGFLKPFYPHVSDKIFGSMEKTPSDFMLWLGDNLYYRPKHYRSFKGMYSCQVRTRKFKSIDNFIRSKPQYAIWDDHDYGPNDSDRNFPLRDSSLSVHKNFWANAFFGTEKIPGTFSNVKIYDCEFFLLDNRYYRTGTDDTLAQILGEQQLQWLLDNLKTSTAVFKFIAVGTQMLNSSTPHECFTNYPSERQKIFDFIKENKIAGVIFLTGDIHHSVLMKTNRLCDYPIYDFTCSPLTSMVHDSHIREFENPDVVKDKIALTYNYGRISVSGSENERKCTFEIFNSTGEKLWDYVIPEEELRCNRE